MNIKAAGRRAYESTDKAKLDELVRQRTKWLRRQTIAIAKLTEISFEIAVLCDRLAKEKVGITDDTANKTT